ncbi:unnamed protein product [Rhizoctonia solani]|uniref:Subtilisin-like serine protease family protein n=2 Tax=Rhizoctonia solani AG-3 TaxID=1086053 RepID=A0A074RQ46_9AGAM|nr:subtilisin-like serine protease family protein [Rhizoctonia solani AG-3 Rhs1AP]KEP46773.1 subtilisin-like serine protease family protein [Rhizoctonia solani 123E]CAE6443819.1 unnamed protein product [Rhizoctonia solani]
MSASKSYDNLPKSYIVLLKKDTPISTRDHLEWMSRPQPMGIGASLGSGTDDVTLDIKHEFQSLKGYSAVLPPSTLEMLNDCGDVDMIVQNTKVIHCADDPLIQVIATQADAPWGLQRISQKDPLPRGSAADSLSYQYRQIPPGLQSTPVDVYVLDSGVKTDHTEFLPVGRATWGWTFPGFPQEEVPTDHFGHGTHVAGTIAGTKFGVAKEANIIAVKVLDNDGMALSDSIAAGIDWVIERVKKQNAEGNRRASIINMSLRSEPNLALDRIANHAVSHDIHVVVSAGNDFGGDEWSPARAQDVITVGATTIKDEWYDLSNYGRSVNILAPGKDIWSADVASTTSKRNGTSQAAAFVSGTLAWLISVQGDSQPAGLFAELKNRSIARAVKDVPRNTVNLLLNNGV